MKIAELFVRLSADTSGLKRGMAGAEASVTSFGKTAQRVGLLLGAGLFAGIVKNSIEAQNAIAQLNAVVKSTGGAAGFATPQLTKMAGELQKVSTFSDEAIMGAQGLLLTFTKIKGPEFQGATQAVMDLAQAMGGDLKGAAIQVGKALNDPKVGLTALRRVGVSFSEAQVAVIKRLQETGDMAGAQKLILQELQVEFGGSAAAARNTLGGALTALKNAFGDLLEVSGESSKGVVGALNSITAAMPTVSAHIGRGLDTIKDQFRRFKRDIMALNLGQAWADAQLRFWDPAAAKELEKARQKFWQSQDAIDPLTLAPAVVSAPKGSGGGSGVGREAPSAEEAAREVTRIAKLLDIAQDKAQEFWRSFEYSGTPAIDRISERLEGMFDLAKVPKVRAREGFGSWLTNQVGEFTPEQINPWAKSTAEIPKRLDTLGDRLREGLGDVGTMLINGLAGVANAMLLGGKGRGSQIGGGLGGAVGGALGGAIMGGKLGAFGGPVGMAVGSVIGTLAGSLFGGLFDKKKKVAKGLDLMAAGLNRVNEALRNTPSGYRVRLATFEATKPPPPPPLPEGPRAGPEGPGGTGSGPRGGPRGGPMFYIAELSVLANDATSLVREIGRAAEREAARGGTSRLALAVGGV